MNKTYKLWEKIIQMDIGKLFLIMLILELVYEITCCWVFSTLGIEYSQNTVKYEDLPNSPIDRIMFICGYGFLEEVVFRWIPVLLFTFILFISEKVVRVLKIEAKIYFEISKKYGSMMVLVFFSLLFGFIHGNIFNIFLQGYGGLCLSIIYLKVYYDQNSDEDDILQLKPLYASSLYHIMWNTMVWAICDIFSELT